MGNCKTLSSLAVVLLIAAGTVGAAEEPVSHNRVDGTALAYVGDLDFGDAGVDATSFQDVVGQPDAEARGCGNCRAQTGKSCCSGCNSCGSGWIGYLDWLYWRAERPGMDFAIGSTGPGPSVYGPIESVSFDHASGIRSCLGYRFPSGWEITWNYTYFHTTGAALYAAAPGTFFRTTRGHPTFAEGATTAEASASLDYDINDLQIARSFRLHNTAALQVFGGFRWAIIDQDLDILYDGWNYDNGVIDNPIRMDGYGIRLGAEGRWTNSRWSLFGRAATSLLVGKFDTYLLQTDDTGGLIVDVSNSFTQGVPALEAAAGIAWRQDWLEICGGYELISWFNMAERMNFHDDRDQGNWEHPSNDVTLHGFFLRLSLIR